MNTDSFTVKAYLAPDEVRRFSVDSTACCSIDYMRQRLHHIFSVPLEEPLVVMWKDDEGDLITASSNEELHDAVNHRVDGVIRLYLSRRTEQPPTSTPPFNPPPPPLPFLHWAPWAWHGAGHREMRSGRKWGRRSWRARRWQRLYEHRPDGERQERRLVADMEEVMAGALRPFGVDVTLIPTTTDEKKADGREVAMSDAEENPSPAEGDIGRALHAIKLK